MTHLIENVNLESSSSDCSYCSMNCYASCNDSCNYRCFGGSGDDCGLTDEGDGCAL